MIYFYILLIVAAICGLILLVSFFCYRKCFYSAPRVPLEEGEYNLPSGPEYEKYHKEMIAWVDAKRSLPQEDLSVTSFDGLTLNAKYYEYAPGAPIEIIFHGYRGTAERDLSGAIERCFSIGRNAVLVEQRAAGTSAGSVITFGINECRDCIVWIDRIIERFGSDVKIILAGVSMGAATVTMASAEKLPTNVKYVIADCGYTCPEDIIKKSVRELGLPPRFLYPFIKLGARIFGHFDLSENSPLKAVKSSRVPIFFIHGDGDDFVPCEMSRILYEACVAPKKFVTVPGAAHGLAFPADKELYIRSLREFEREISLSLTKETDK